MTTKSENPEPEITLVAGEYFSDDERGVRLHISECQSCANRWFPPVSICSQCAGTDLIQIDSGAEGVAYASTVVRVGPPRFPAPYVLSYVDIDGVRVLIHTEAAEALAPGTAVELTTGSIGRDADATLMSYVVRPVGAGTNSESGRS